MLTPPLPLTVLLGKAVKNIARLRGGGSALPGLFVESIDKNFLSSRLKELPRGVVLISGTNGKTTTTKMVVELLEGQGLKVFTNRTGSNFTRGVVAALLGEINMSGQLAADIAVLELDEAHAVQFVRAVHPRHCLLLNVMRDQLDRFGEIDATARLLQTVAEHTTETVVVNREDPRLLNMSLMLNKPTIRYFGLENAMRHEFPSDDDMRGSSLATTDQVDAISTLVSFNKSRATFQLNDNKFSASLKLEGVYNIYNATAAMALVQSIFGDALDDTALVRSLESITPAFGRGETVIVDGMPFELVLVKNPGGFRLSLKSFDATGYATMVAINDDYADGRDMSWLWDVDFESLRPNISQVTGVRAYDMALRLQYDEVDIRSVEPNISNALHHFIQSNKESPKRVYCTYTAMLALRRELSKITKVEVVS